MEARVVVVREAAEMAAVTAVTAVTAEGATVVVVRAGASALELDGEEEDGRLEVRPQRFGLGEVDARAECGDERHRVAQRRRLLTRAAVRRRRVEEAEADAEHARCYA